MLGQSCFMVCGHNYNSNASTSSDNNNIDNQLRLITCEATKYDKLL